jgi:hypothetical protein
MAYSVSLITLQPPPTFLVEIPESVNPHWPRIEWVGLLKDAASLIEPVISWIDLARFRFTGVSWDRFEVVCSTGIDVTPTDSTIYVAEFEKALEYGDWPKVIIALRTEQLHSTFREVAADTQPEQLAELQCVFRTKVRSADGSKLWLSRLDADDPNVTTSYEALLISS